MPSFPSRDKYSNWFNETPITNLNEVLDVLKEKSTAIEPHFLSRKNGRWEIVLPWYRDGSSGGDTWGCHYLQIDPKTAETLISERLVVPNEVKRLGYTETQKDVLVISRKGREQIKEFINSMITKADGMLKPGVHTDLTGKPEHTGCGREDWRYGRFCVKYKMPSGETCCVFPEQNILVVEPLEKAIA